MRPKKLTFNGRNYYYQATDIDPLLDELEAYRKIIPDPYATIGGGRIEVGNMKPFPSLEEFEEWFKSNLSSNLLELIHTYFSQFCYEKTVFPKVGHMVEGEWWADNSQKFKGRLDYYVITTEDDNMQMGVVNIRPVTTPTREEVIEMYKIKPEHLEILKG